MLNQYLVCLHRMMTGQGSSVWTQIDIGSIEADSAHLIREAILATLDDRHVLIDDSESNGNEPTKSPDLVITVGKSSLSGSQSQGVVSTPTVHCVTDPDTARSIEASSSPMVTAFRWNPDSPNWEFLPAAVERVCSASDSKIGQYEQLIETVADGVYVLDEHGRFDQVNDSLCELTGYDREELIGSSVHLIKDDKTVKAAENSLRGLLRGDLNGQAVIDVEIQPKSGDPIPCEDRMTLLPPADGFQGTVGSLRDIRAQQRREEMFSQLLTVTGEMLAADTPREVAEIITETATKSLDLPLSTVRFVEDSRLVPVAESDATSELMPERPVYEIGDGPVGTVYAEQKPRYHTVDDIGDDRDRGETTAAFYLPLGSHGTLSVGSAERSGLEEQDRYFVRLLAQSAASALDRIVRERELEEYEAIINSVDDMAFVVDQDDTFRLFTEPFADFVGYDRDELADASYDLIDDGTINSLVSRIRDDGTSSGSVESITETATLTDATGAEQSVRLTASPVDAPQFPGVVFAMDDTSALISAREEAYRAKTRTEQLFDTVTDPVIELKSTDDGVIVNELNDSFAQLTTGSVVGEPIASLGASLCDRALADRIETLLSNEAEVSADSRSDPLTIQTPNGRRDYVTRGLSAEIDGQTHIFMIFTDITGLRQRETQLAVLGRVLRHNLRNEMNVVQGFAQEIERDAADETLSGRASRISNASSRLLSLSETARRAQTAVAGTTERQPTTVTAVINDSLEFITKPDDEEDFSVEIHDRGTVRVSPHFPMALAELIDNALKHGEPPVTVSIARLENRMEFTIHDAGPGIPDHEWEVVAGDADISQLQHGSGLGLWLVRWVVDRHGGDLIRDTASNGTTTVGLWLPITEGDSLFTE